MAAFSRSSSLLSSELPFEADLAEERPLDHDEDHADAALELLGAHLDVVEEPEPEDGPHVVAERGRRERVADLGLHPIQDGRRLDPAVALDDDVPDGRDGRGRLGSAPAAGPSRWGQREESDQRREKDPAPSSGGLPCGQPPDESQGHSSGERGPGGQRSARLSVGSETGSKTSPSPWTRTSIWIAVLDPSGDDGLGQRILDVLLDDASELPRPVGRVEALLDQEVHGLGGQADPDRPLLELPVHAIDHELHDAPDVLLVERVEDDHLVDPVEELRPERPLELVEHAVLHPLVGAPRSTPTGSRGWSACRSGRSRGWTS